MNSVNLIGRITRDPEVRYTEQSQTAYARFAIAIDRGKDKNGNDLGADYPSIRAVGKLAEVIEKYCYKGQLVGIAGKIQTGSYEKDGKKVYTTDVFASSVQFLSKKETQDENAVQPAIPEGFTQITDEDIPF